MVCTLSAMTKNCRCGEKREVPNKRTDAGKHQAESPCPKGRGRKCLHFRNLGFELFVNTYEELGNRTLI